MTLPLITSGPFAELPRNYFRTILADPPWRFQTYDRATAVTARGRIKHYDTMTIKEIKALPVMDLAANDCLLVLWISSPMLSAALDVVHAWGFEFQTFGFVWGKVHQGRPTGNRHGLLDEGRRRVGTARHQGLAEAEKPRRPAAHP